MRFGSVVIWTGAERAWDDDTEGYKNRHLRVVRDSAGELVYEQSETEDALGNPVWLKHTEPFPAFIKAGAALLYEQVKCYAQAPPKQETEL